LIGLIPQDHRAVFAAAALYMADVAAPNPVRREARKLTRQSRNRKRAERRKKVRQH
jgi:hypothetical protein